MQSDLFPNNSRSCFRSYINSNDISHEYEYMVAVKSITFDNDIIGKKHYALKSSISSETISSAEFDNVLALFSTGKEGINTFHFFNPSFFYTSHYNLCNPEFKIIDLSTGEHPHFKFGSPTFIEIILKKVEIGMKLPFIILLDSSCEKSKLLSPLNHSTEFTIQLPMRLEFSKNWLLCLKSIHFENDFKTQEKFQIIFFGKRLSNGKSFIQSASVHLTRDKEDLIRNLKSLCAGFITVEEKDGFFNLKLAPDYNEHNPNYCTQLGIQISNGLIQVLGLGVEFSQFVLENSMVVESYRKIDLSRIYPHNFLVSTDICDESIFSGSKVQILKYFPCEQSGSMVNLNFRTNDFVEMYTGSFDRIKIRISDLSGKTLESINSTPSRLQILIQPK